MRAGSFDGFGRFAGVAMVGFMLAGLVAGVTTASDQEGASSVATLSDVSVHQDGDVTVVTLAGVGNPIYTAVGEEDSQRLVVDLDAVTPGGAPEELALASGQVRDVSVAAMSDNAGNPFTRVALSVDGAFDYDVISVGDSLEVHVSPAAGDRLAMAEPAATSEVEASSTGFEEAPPASFETFEAAPVAGDMQSFEAPPAEPQPVPTVLDEVEPSLASDASEPHYDVERVQAAKDLGLPPPPPLNPAPPARPAQPATTLTGVERGEGTVHLVADGEISGVEPFVLENPGRLVIDLPGYRSHVAKSVALNGEQVKQVRVGEHADKVRVVLDANGAKFASYRVVPVADGLVIAFGDAQVMMASTTPAPAPAPGHAPMAAMETAPVADLDDSAPMASMAVTPVAMEATPATDADRAAAGGNRVLAVEFDASAADSDTIVIRNQGDPSYHVFEPDDTTVIVSLLGTSLAPGAEARITPAPGGPVSLVMAFQQPELVRPEVRIVVKRGPGLHPTITRTGPDVFVRFPKVEGAAPAPTPMTEAPAAAMPGQAASTAPAKAMAAARAQAAPAAIDPNVAGIDVLEEGGLLDGKQYIGRRISLDFKAVDIDDVLRLIAEVSDLNIIAAENVQGKVTIRLIDVPWDQALDVILLTKGLGFLKVGNVLRIAPQGVLQNEAERRLQQRRAKEKLEDMVVKFQPVNYAQVGQVKGMVARLLTGRGSVNVDNRTNTVIIKDIPSVIDEAVALIKAIDTPTPQVLIEAKIVEASLDFSRELGTEWGAQKLDLTDPFDKGSATLTDTAFHNDPRILTGTNELNNFVVSNPLSAAPSALMNIGSFLLNDKWNLEFQLQAAESAGEGKVISSPRVVTLDNREATIKQGVAIPFQTFENGDAQLQFVDAVLELKVKPHITADRSIIMKLQVSRNAPDDSVAAQGGATAIAKNEAKTETLVRDGQTLVIGGIYTIQKSDRQSRVPYLHKIPFLGLLFRNYQVRDLRKELLVFVTPRVVEVPQYGQ